MVAAAAGDPAGGFSKPRADAPAGFLTRLQSTAPAPEGRVAASSAHPLPHAYCRSSPCGRANQPRPQAAVR